MDDKDVKFVKLTWSTQRGFFDEKRMVNREELEELKALQRSKKPTPNGFLIFIGDPT